MKTSSSPKIYQSILFFGLISTALTVVRTLVNYQFDLKRLLTFNFVVYEIIVELICVCLTAFITYLIAKRITKNSLGNSLLKSFLFSLVYSVICFIYLRIFWVYIIGGAHYRFDLYNSSIRFIPNGLFQGILFMFVYNQLNPTNEDKSERLADQEDLLDSMNDHSGKIQ